MADDDPRRVPLPAPIQDSPEEGRMSRDLEERPPQRGRGEGLQAARRASTSMERKKGIDHEQVGTDVSKREDERLDIVNNPKDRPSKEDRERGREGSDRSARPRGGSRDDESESTG